MTRLCLSVRMFLALGLLLVGLRDARAQVPPAVATGPERFASEIESFRQWDRKNAVPASPIVFVGSSTIRLWPTATSFPNLPVVNRGFGGSQIADATHFVADLVTRYSPDIVVFYAGDNDINAGKSPDTVLSDYRSFVDRVVAATPTTRIVFLAIKPSVARWKLWPTMNEANDKIRAFSASRPNLHFLDVATPMLGPNQSMPSPSLFVDDGLHMSPDGYAMWNRLVAASLPTLRGGK